MKSQEITVTEVRPVLDPRGVVKVVQFYGGKRNISQAFFFPEGARGYFKDGNLCIPDPKSTQQQYRPDIEYPLSVVLNGGGEGAGVRKKLNEQGVLVSSPGKLNRMIKYRP